MLVDGVSCVPPTALLSQRHIVEAVDFDVDQPNRDRVVRDCELRRSQKGAVVFLQSGTDLRPPTLVAFFFPVAGLFVATQYEIPFKLSISTFHVSVMAITPAIASHKVRHPWW